MWTLGHPGCRGHLRTLDALDAMLWRFLDPIGIPSGYVNVAIENGH